MAKKIKEIDSYIAKAQPFAQPVMKHFRELVHKTCPDVEEKMKWSFPHFDYKGQMMCSMASFKQHCVIGFWKAQLIDGKLVDNAKSEVAMGHMGRLTSLKDLPPDKQLVTWIRKAMKLNDEGIVISKPKPSEKDKKEFTVPRELTVAINKNKKAKATWDKASYSFRKEYVMWVDETKTEATRNKRIETTVEWVSEGKARNWKYER